MTSAPKKRLASQVRTFAVNAYREGSWWMVSIPEIDGLTQAPSLEEVPTIACDYIAVTLGIDVNSVDVDVVDVSRRR